MRKCFKYVTCLLFFGFITHVLTAQADTLRKKSDSLNEAILSDYNKKLEQIEKQRVADSITKVNLELQLNALKTTDNLKKEELQNKLQALNDKEVKRVEEKKARIDSLRSTAKSYPVAGFFNDTLFSVYAGLGSFSAHDRAEAITARIAKLSSYFGFKTDSLFVIESETTVDLYYKETIIISISETDALWNNTTKLELAEKYKHIIGKAVMNYKKETNVITILKEVGFAVLVLVVWFFLVALLFWLFRWVSKKIESEKGKLIKGIRIRTYTLFDAHREVKAIITVVSIFRWLLVIILSYVAMLVLFRIFPWTKSFADVLLSYFISPLKQIAISLWHYLPKLFTIIVLVFIFRYVLKGLHFLKNEIERGHLRINGFYPDWANPTYQIIRVVVFAFMLVVIFPYLPGSDSPVFQGVSVFLGFLFTFGSSGSLSNVVAGLVLTYMRLFNLGDRVKIGEVTGDVIEKTLLVTRIRTIKNEIISIPNSTVMNSHTINYSSDVPDKGLIIYTTVTIGYDVPWKDMHRALIDAAMKTDMILHEPAPFVLQLSLDDFYVSYQINAYTKEPNKQATIYSNLHQNIQDVCNERGIEIMSPHYKAARDGNTTTIPANYLPPNYVAPAFKVQLRNTDKEDPKA